MHLLKHQGTYVCMYKNQMGKTTFLKGRQCETNRHTCSNSKGASERGQICPCEMFAQNVLIKQNFPLLKKTRKILSHEGRKTEHMSCNIPLKSRLAIYNHTYNGRMGLDEVIYCLYSTVCGEHCFIVLIVYRHILVY